MRASWLPSLRVIIATPEPEPWSFTSWASFPKSDPEPSFLTRLTAFIFDDADAAEAALIITGVILLFVLVRAALPAIAAVLSRLHTARVSRLRTPNFHRPTRRRFRARRRENFPPPYPNGWFHVCNATDVANGRVHAISALGLELVAFREAHSGRVGILDAFCPHLGAHLAEGGIVVGDTVKCPFHGWQFDVRGQATAIPYTRLENVPERCKTTAYEVREHLDMIWLWFDAEGRPPSWELRQHRDIVGEADGVADGEGNGKTMNRSGGSPAAYRLVRAKQLSFEMHLSEMAENSADAYHL